MTAFFLTNSVAVPSLQNNGGSEHLELVELGNDVVHFMRPVPEVVDCKQAKLLYNGKICLKGFNFFLNLYLSILFRRHLLYWLLRSVLELLRRVNSWWGHYLLYPLLLVRTTASNQISDIEQSTSRSPDWAWTSQILRWVEVELAFWEYLILDLQLNVNLPANVHILLLFDFRDVRFLILLKNVSNQLL